jgi:hypothetical protein
MLDEDVICRGLQDQLRGLEQQIEMLRDDLEDPELTPAQKGLIRQQIQQLPPCQHELRHSGLSIH